MARRWSRVLLRVDEVGAHSQAFGFQSRILGPENGKLISLLALFSGELVGVLTQKGWNDLAAVPSEAVEETDQRLFQGEIPRNRHLRLGCLLHAALRPFWFCCSNWTPM